MELEVQMISMWLVIYGVSYKGLVCYNDLPVNINETKTFVAFKEMVQNYVMNMYKM